MNKMTCCMNFQSNVQKKWEIWANRQEEKCGVDDDPSMGNFRLVAWQSTRDCNLRAVGSFLMTCYFIWLEVSRLSGIDIHVCARNPPSRRLCGWEIILNEARRCRKREVLARPRICRMARIIQLELGRSRVMVRVVVFWVVAAPG